ncbi:xylose isomerase, partial [Candidatus Uhrbacteria bacterium]|nr:xylose isomerase [Candidatus Uhrbacteria bacterium]
MMNKWFPKQAVVPYDPRAKPGQLAFRHYNPDGMIGTLKMSDVLRFSVAAWHAMCNPLADPFGVGTRPLPWNDHKSPRTATRQRAEALFEFCGKCRIPFYCWHNWDLAEQGNNLRQSEKNLDEAAKWLGEFQQQTGISLGWGTSNLFSDPRYRGGAATSPDPHVFAYAASEVSKMMEVTKLLGGAGYTFWGGREGYDTLVNTHMGFEIDRLGQFLNMAVVHKKDIGANFQFYIEPKRFEPKTEQYDADAASCFAFLQRYGLTGHFKLNIEKNHATLAHHTLEHELTYAAHYGILGSVDANTGNTLLGWDTDQFPTDPAELVLPMLVILGQGGLGTGVFNFDAKLRRE